MENQCSNKEKSQGKTQYDSEVQRLEDNFNSIYNLVTTKNDFSLINILKIINVM